MNHKMLAISSETFCTAINSCRIPGRECSNFFVPKNLPMKPLEEMVDQTETFEDDGEEYVWGYRNIMILCSTNVPVLLTDEAI